MSKQDRQGVRKATDLEQKYNFGKSFAEVFGIAEDAQKTAEEAKEAAKTVDENLTPDEIFDRLTDGGERQGIYKDEETNDYYINAEYIRALEKLFANDITMTGQFESTAETYLPPTYDDAILTLWAAYFPEEYSLPEEYDFDLNGDGVFNWEDAVTAVDVYTGRLSMKDCPGAVKTPVTLRINMSDPQKLIHIFGTNMWGTYVETFIGADVNNGSFASREYLQRMMNQQPDSSILYRTVDGEEEYFNPPMEVGVEYRTTERYMGKPVYVQLVSFDALPNTSQRNKNVYYGGGTSGTKIHQGDIVDITGRAYLGYNAPSGSAGEWSAFPFVSGGKAIGADIWYDWTLGIVVRTQSDLSGQLAWFTVKYTKTRA